MPKKENNRKNFSGYKKWKEEKERRNRAKGQIFEPDTKTWRHFSSLDEFVLGAPNVETSTS